MIVLMAAGAATLAGCMTTPDPTEVGPPPANYKAIMAEHVRTAFFDPYSVRDASIAPPKAGNLSTEMMTVATGHIVCMKANAKNRMGAYIGLTTSAYLIRDGKVAASHDGLDHYEVRTACADAVYEPFPEIEETSGARDR